MSADPAAAARFVAGAARLLDRHRHAALLEGGRREPVLAALRAYQNPDGGFGHALEPDLRAPGSQPGATLYALEMLAELEAFADPMVAGALRWIAGVAAADGGVPFVVGDVGAWPHAPWWQPEPSSFLTAGLAAALLAGGAHSPWLERAGDWSWAQVEHRAVDSAYWWRHLVAFLDRARDSERAERALARLREPLLASGLVAVDPHAGGAERLTPLDYSPWPGLRSRALFAPAAIEAHLDALEAGQREDGGWDFPWPAWSPGATLDWRGWLTVHALRVLRAHGRLP
jgi:hypothetical protein